MKKAKKKVNEKVKKERKKDNRIKSRRIRNSIRNYIVICVITLLIALFWQSVWIRTLLAYEILLVPILWIQAGYLGRHLEAKLSIPVRYTGRKQEFVIEAEVKNGSKMAMSAVPVKICCKNVFTGECIYIEETAMVEAGNTAVLRFFMTAEHCGMIEVSLESAEVRDYLQLFSKGKKCKDQKEEIMVLPNVHEIQMGQISHTLEKQEGNHYSQNKNGEDTSEVFDVREYRAGDTYHRIHWKLSAKTDEFLVKEYSLPQEQDVCIFLDLYLEQKNAGRAGIQERMDEFLEILASISWSMQKKHWYHSIIWWDKMEQRLRKVKITSEKETYEMLEQVCLSGFYDSKFDVEKFYTEQTGCDINRHGKYGEHGMRLSVDGSISIFDGVTERSFTSEQLDGDWNQWKQAM